MKFLRLSSSLKRLAFKQLRLEILSRTPKSTLIFLLTHFLSLTQFRNLILKSFSLPSLLKMHFLWRSVSLSGRTLYLWRFFKNGPTPASFSFIFGLFKQTIQILQQIKLKKGHVHPVYSARIRTHDLSNMSRLP